jgi:hypothetical protein
MSDYYKAVAKRTSRVKYLLCNYMYKLYIVRLSRDNDTVSDVRNKFISDYRTWVYTIFTSVNIIENVLIVILIEFKLNLR